jgi:hypothetical protein
MQFLHRHGPTARQARDGQVHTLLRISPSHLLPAARFHALDRRVGTVYLDVIDDMSPLDLLVASLGLVRTLDDEFVEHVEQELGSRSRCIQSSRPPTSWAGARVLLPAICVLEAVAAEMVVTVCYDDWRHKHAPTDWAQEVAVIVGHMFKCSKIYCFVELHHYCACLDSQQTIRW